MRQKSNWETSLGCDYAKGTSYTGTMQSAVDRIYRSLAYAKDSMKLCTLRTRVETFRWNGAILPTILMTATVTEVIRITHSTETKSRT